MAGVIGIAGNGGCASTSTPAKTLRADGPSVEGVRLGDSGARALEALGQPDGDSGVFAPAGKGPTEIDHPDAIVVHGTWFALRYPDLVVVVGGVTARAGTVQAFMVSGQRDGVEGLARVGEPLKDVKRRMPLTCRAVGGVTSDASGPSWPYCVRRLRSHLYLGVGGDPIRSVVLASVPIAPPARVPSVGRQAPR